MPEKIVTVFGATGNQGGSVLRALVGDKQYKVRAVTRNPESEKAKAFVEQGCEVVKADIDDPSTLKPALHGAYGTFLVTNFLEHRDAAREMNQGKAVVDAASEAGVKHLVFSGLENVESKLGKPCEHFDSKSRVIDYIKEKGIPHTIILYSCYYENFEHILKPKKNDEGIYEVSLPTGDHPVHMVCASQAGEVTRQVLNNPGEYLNKTIGISSDKLTVAQMKDTFAKVFPERKFGLGKVTLDMMNKRPGMTWLATMYEFFCHPAFKRDPVLTRKLHPGIPTFEQWLTTNKEKMNKLLDAPPFNPFRRSGSQ